MPAKAGIQYAATLKIELWRREILNHPLSRMMTTVQNTLARHDASNVARAKGVTKCLRLP
jgi:hypothetical protein